MKNFSFLILLLACSTAVFAERTTRRNLKPAVTGDEISQSVTAYDTVATPDASVISVNGYDKPLRSRRETFFATNNSTADIERIAFSIRYFDSKQRLLHQTVHNVRAAIPAGETRQINIPSWDTQFNFYYLRSAIPQRAQQATPYDVRISVDTLFFNTSETSRQ